MYDEMYFPGTGLVLVTNEDGECYWGAGIDPNTDPAEVEESLRQQMEDRDQFRGELHD